MVLLSAGAALHFHERNTISKSTVISGGAISSLARGLRPIYPYSVIPGGAFSAVELQRATERDRYVGQHYRDFDLRHARLVTLARERYQYVSYRVKDRIFWTKKRLRIPGGEVLLTDGRNYARTRCGNRLSSYPHRDTTDLEPPLRSLSLPPVTRRLLPDLELAKTSDLDPSGELPTLSFEAPPLVSPLPSNGLEALLVRPPGSLPDSPFYTPPGSGYGYAPFFGESGGEGPPIHSGLEVSFVDTPPAEVPEPTGLYVFGVTFLVSPWVLTRMMRGTTEFDSNFSSD
jgi:hypothetical protein